MFDICKNHAIIFLGVTIHGRRLALILEGFVPSGREGMPMTIEDFIAVLSLVLTSLSIGYTIGINKRK